MNISKTLPQKRKKRKPAKSLDMYTTRNRYKLLIMIA